LAPAFDGGRRSQMASRVLVLATLALSPLSSGSDYAGISRAEAVRAARAYVVRVDYRGNEPLFYRNTGNRPAAALRTSDATGRRAWFVRFDDLQAMHKNCVTVRRGLARVITRGTTC
jgi:hypothetical protein